jgi:hypothetical protein
MGLAIADAGIHLPEPDLPLSPIVEVTAERRFTLCHR